MDSKHQLNLFQIKTRYKRQSHLPQELLCNLNNKHHNSHHPKTTINPLHPKCLYITNQCKTVSINNKTPNLLLQTNSHLVIFNLLIKTQAYFLKGTCSHLPSPWKFFNKLVSPLKTQIHLTIATTPLIPIFVVMLTPTTIQFVENLIISNIQLIKHQLEKNLFRQP